MKQITEKELDQMKSPSACKHTPEVVSVTIGKETMFVAICQECNVAAGLRVSERAALTAWERWAEYAK